MELFFIECLGEVLLDGVNTKSLKLEWLRHQIGLVTQEPALSNLSISDNIAYGRLNITSDQIQEAAKYANVHAFISSLENGYDTQVCIHNFNLSQKPPLFFSPFFFLKHIVICSIGG